MHVLWLLNCPFASKTHSPVEAIQEYLVAIATHLPSSRVPFGPHLPGISLINTHLPFIRLSEPAPLTSISQSSVLSLLTHLWLIQPSLQPTSQFFIPIQSSDYMHSQLSVGLGFSSALIIFNLLSLQYWAFSAIVPFESIFERQTPQSQTLNFDGRIL